MTDLSLTITQKIAASPETVFNAWLDPDMIRQFMAPRADTRTTKATLDPVVGGRFDFLMASEEEEYPHHGIYKEITPHTRLAFTWQSPFSVEDSTVTLDFKPVGAETELTLTHVKFATETARDSHAGGWGAILNSLSLHMAG